MSGLPLPPQAPVGPLANAGRGGRGAGRVGPSAANGIGAMGRGRADGLVAADNVGGRGRGRFAGTGGGRFDSSQWQEAGQARPAPLQQQGQQQPQPQVRSRTVSLAPLPPQGPRGLLHHVAPLQPAPGLGAVAPAAPQLLPTSPHDVASSRGLVLPPISGYIRRGAPPPPPLPCRTLSLFKYNIIG